MIDSTTKKQSEKLLKLGLSSDSADMFIGSDGMPHCKEDQVSLESLGCSFVCDSWSVGRLLSILVSQDHDIQFFGCPQMDNLEYLYGRISHLLEKKQLLRFDKITWDY